MQVLLLTYDCSILGQTVQQSGLADWKKGSSCSTACQVKALYEAPEGFPHLLPFYGRVAASLAQVFPDIAVALLRQLEDEFATLLVMHATQAPKQCRGFLANNFLSSMVSRLHTSKLQLIPALHVAGLP